MKERQRRSGKARIGPINILCHVLYCELIGLSFVVAGLQCYLRTNEAAVGGNLMERERQSLKKDPTVTPESTGRKGGKICCNSCGGG